MTQGPTTDESIDAVWFNIFILCMSSLQSFNKAIAAYQQLKRKKKVKLLWFKACSFFHVNVQSIANIHLNDGKNTSFSSQHHVTAKKNEEKFKKSPQRNSTIHKNGTYCFEPLLHTQTRAFSPRCCFHDRGQRSKAGESEKRFITSVK